MNAKVFYASGSKGKTVRADGNGSYMQRGYYVKFEGSSYRGGSHGTFGPFKTKTLANIRAFGTPREPNN